MIKTSTVFIAAYVFFFCFLIPGNALVEASTLPPRETTMKSDYFIISYPSCVWTKPFSLFAETDKNNVSNFVELFSPVAPQTEPLPKVKTEKPGKNAPKRIPDDVVYRLQISALTFIIGFLLGLLR